MAETIQMNVIVLPITRERVERMARDTFRGKGDLIDWLVSEAYKKMYPNNGGLADILASNPNEETKKEE